MEEKGHAVQHKRRDRFFPSSLHTEIVLSYSALNDKLKKILLFPARRKTVNLMEMFKTRNMILDGAKAATNMRKIRDIT